MMASLQLKLRKRFKWIAAISPPMTSQSMASATLGLLEPKVKQIITRGARRCVLLVRSIKYAQPGIMRICGWDDVDVLVTDNSLSLEARQAICSQGTEVMVADVPGTSVS